MYYTYIFKEKGACYNAYFVSIFSVTDDAILIKYILTAWNPRHILRFIPFLLRQFQQSTQHFQFNSPHYWYHLILEGMLKSTSILLILQTLILLTQHSLNLWLLNVKKKN